jgi:hypothetical protein
VRSPRLRPYLLANTLLFSPQRALGVLRFGEYANAYRYGAKVRVRREEKDVLRAVRKDLRIIPDALWHEAQAQIQAARTIYVRDTGGKLWGRPGSVQESRYLLTWFLRMRRLRLDALMRGDVPAARQALRKLLARRIEFLPEEKDGTRRYHLRWAMTVKPLMGDGYIALASPRRAKRIPAIRCERRIQL